MKHITIILLIILIGPISKIAAQETKDYIEFNDRKNIVHGFYLGINPSYGEIDGKDTYIMSLKVAYVVNRQFEIGFEAKGFYSQQNIPGIFTSNTADLGGVYAGLHLEPIMFSKSRINLSFPILIGAGATGYINDDWDDDELDQRRDEEWDAIFVVEPGINMLYNISRYVQLETGIKYRFSSTIDLSPDTINKIDGFSVGFGLKVGIFNLGRNRYKKNVPSNE